MNVYIVTREQFPNGMASTKRITCLSKAIISQGISCKVLIYTRTEVYGKKPKNTNNKGVFEDIPFQYMGETPLRGKNSIIRQFHDITDKIRLLFFFLNYLKKNDIVISCVGQDAKYIHFLIKVIHYRKAKFVREICELPYGTGKESNYTIKMRNYVLEKIISKCDGIISISDTLSSLCATYKTKECPIIKVPILVDYKQYYLEDHSSEVEVPYIFHSGTLYDQKDGILGMLKAFGKATQKLDKNIHFISTGTPNKSPHYHDIKRIIKDYQLEDKVTFTGYLSNEQLKDFLSKASLTIINKYPNQQNTYCFSTKLGEYLAAGKPVIITKVGEAMNWLKDGVNAFIIEPNNTDILATTIINAFNNSERRKRIALNGQIVCKNSFDYRCYCEVIHHFLNAQLNN